MLELVNFCKSYSRSDFKVNNISLKVEKGHIAGLLGPNGSGKTTIIKGLCGIHYPDSGSVLIDSIDTKKNVSEIPEHIGYVPEISILPQDFVVYRFLAYCGSIHGLQGDSLTESVKKVVKQCSLQKVLSKKIKQLSKGFQQRVSFAQALIHNPDNLILDEPVSGLDPSQILQMRNLIKTLSENKAILLSTHLLQEVYSLCTEIYIMNEGKISGSGKEEDILKKTGCKTLEDAFVKLTGEADNE